MKVWYNVATIKKGKISNPIFAECLDGIDVGVRLDWYDWDVEYCYMEQEKN